MSSNNVIKVGIDFGASRIKYVYEGTQGTKRNGIMLNKYLIGNNNAGTGYKVVRADRINKVGAVNGVPNIQRVKVNCEYLDDIILAICKDIKNNTGCKSDMTLSINALLPPSQYLSIAENFREKLLSYGTFEGEVNGDKLKVTIKDVGICCEGVSQLTNMDIYKVCSLDTALLIDAGSSTIDIVQLSRDNGHWEVVDADTINEVSGSLIMKDIALGLCNEYPTIPFKASELESRMYFYIGETKHNVIDYIEFADDRISKLGKMFKDYYIGGKVLVSGGAGELLMASKIFRDICPAEAILLDENIRTFGNARGAYFS